MSSLISIFLLLLIFGIHQYESTPLDDYVHADDPHFSWDIITVHNELEYKMYVLNFTSQKWLDETFSTRSIWWHYLSIIVPNKLTRPNAAALFINGGTNDDTPPTPLNMYIVFTASIALGTGSIAAYLTQVPNVPIRYMFDPTNKTRNEDSALGCSWQEFILNGTNPSMNMLFPMTKASVRAMDAIQQFTNKSSLHTPQKFAITGPSKRGWTAWLTAAVDNQRVIATMPIVMDLLKFQYNLHHHYRVLNGWSLALIEYYECNVTRYLDKQNMGILAFSMDPYNAFWKDLQQATGGSYLRRFPNTDHSCLGHFEQIIESIRSFYISIYENKSLPSMQWVKTINDTHGSIRATVNFTNGIKPISAVVYHSQTLDDKRRDFRLLVANPKDPTKPMVHPVFWYTEPCVIDSQSNTTIVYSFTMAKPTSGWRGFFLEVNFPGPDRSTLDLTTETLVIPDTFPTDDCHDEQCFGTIV